MKSGLFLISMACAADAFGALTATVTSVNQTQAVLQEQGFSGSCSILVSASPALTPLHPDFNGTEYSGASTDTGRADTITSADGSTRLVTIGHQNDDRALAAYTTYYYQVSGCGGTVNGSFTTANLSSGTTRTEQTPFNSSKWGNLGLPSFDWTVKRSYTDPMTGVNMIPMSTSIQTWKTGCGAAGCSSSSRAFTDWAGGSGWSNPSRVLNGATSTANTSNTNPLDLYADLQNAPDPVAYDWHRLLEDIGIVVWGSGSSGATADRVIDLCIIINPAAGCASNTIQVVLPTGSAAHVSSGSSDLDGAFPASFPSSPFFGWTDSASPLIHMENRETFGTVAVSGNTLTIPGANLNPQQHFSSALTAGQKIFIAGSSCANSLCTIAGTPASAGIVNTVEQPGVGSGAFRAYGWGIRVWKDNANGSATVGLRFKIAGSNAPIGVEPGGDRCSTVQVVSGDGKPGYLCSLTSAIAGFGWLAFIANDGTTRILSFRTGFSFDDQQGNVFYAGAQNANGGWTILKYTYTGDYTRELNYNYTCGSGGDCPPINDQISAGVDLMPHSANADLDQQIQANQGTTLPAYNSAIYGPWTGAGTVQYDGSSGHFAFFCNLYSGQGQLGGGGPGWCAVVDLSQSPAKVVRLIHTLDGTGAPNARFASLHSPQEVDSIPNTLFLSLDDLTTNNPAKLHGGPYQAQVVGLLLADGITWSTNTCLDWPAGSGTGCGNQRSYSACPANAGAYTTCITFRLPQDGVCNVSPAAIEKATWPCPWNSGYAQYPKMQVGDNAVDTSAPGGIDSEHFRILSTAPDAGNTLRVVAARNSVYDYCSISPWQGQTDPLSADSAGQFLHSNGWTLTMMPGTFNTCGVGVLLQDQTTGVVQELGHSFAGHFEIGTGSAGINFVTASSTIFNTPFASLGNVPQTNLVKTGDPSFHGIHANIGGALQSYTDDSQLLGAPGYPWAVDMNPIVACGGEQLSCGAPRTLNSVGGTVYKVQAIGSAPASNATYKIQPMIGWAGRYQLQDVSGPSSNVDSTPFSMCFVISPGECHAGSAASDIYVNVPAAYDPGFCAASVSWVNVPCILFGDNAPAGGIRQFRIASNDANGTYSRFVSNGWSSLGRHWPYSHSTVHRGGLWTMMMGTNAMDGYSMTGLMISLPPWQETSASDNDFKTLSAKVPSGLRYAEIEFGYSRYIGPNNAPPNGLFCTARAESCETATTSSETGPGAPFAFASETSTPVPCASGCQIKVPVVGPNLIYYRLRRSDDGQRWVTSDVQAVALP